MSALASNILSFPITAQSSICMVDSSKPYSKACAALLQCSQEVHQPGCGQVPAALTAGSGEGKAVSGVAASFEVSSVGGSHAVQPGDIDGSSQTAEQQQIAPDLAATTTTAGRSTKKTLERLKPGDSARSSSRPRTSGIISSKQPTTVKWASKPPLTVSSKPTSAVDSANSSGGKPASAISKPSNSSVSATAAAASTALAATKLGLHEQLATALAVAPAAATLRDVDGRCCLHYAAAYGYEECVDTLLAKGSSDAVRVRDVNGDLPLHLAAQKSQPMCAYNIAKACPASCLVKNKHNQTPIDLAASTARGEVLNALLLACAGEGKSAVAVAALRALLAAGAVPDTWAPNGSSALMLAAAADGVTALQVLLDNKATIELQDALGRSALMFAAGNNAAAACKLLLDRGASLPARDRRGRAAVDYATAGSEAAVLLQQRLEELERVASQMQQQLLQEQGAAALISTSSPNGSSKPAVTGNSAPVDAGSANNSSQGSQSSAKKKRKKKAGSGKGPADSPAAIPEAGTDFNAAVSADFAVNWAVEETVVASGAAVADAKVAPVTPTAVAATADVSLATATLSPQQKHWSDQQPHTAAGSEGVAAVESAGAAEYGSASCAELEMGDWQVVRPKGKQRPACPTAAVQAAAARSSSSSSQCGHNNGQCCDSMNQQLHHDQSVHGVRQQQRRQQKAPGRLASNQGHSRELLQLSGEASTVSSSMLTRVGGCDLSTTNTCHLTRIDPGHRRQGSSHSLCSTVSMSSYDSCCNSSGPGSTVAAGTPVGSCCSCISCCSHQLQPQQQHSAAGAISCAMRHPICCSGSGSSDQQGCAACSKLGLAEDSADRCALRVVTGKSAATAARSDVQHPTRFKAALLGSSGAQSSVSAAADSNSSVEQQQQQQQLPPPHPLRATTATTSARPVAATSDQQRAILQHQFQGPETLACRPQQQQQEQDLQQQQLLQRAEAEVAALKLLLKQQSVLHQQQLAAILEDAASHEAAAVAAARQAAAADVLQSPMLWQLLAAAAQQAVLTERARLQLRLQQVGLPLAAQLQLLLGPVTAADTPQYPATAAADVEMAVHLNGAAAVADGKGSSNNNSLCGSDTTAAIKDAIASAVAAMQQHHQQQVHLPAVQPEPETVTRCEQQQQQHKVVHGKNRDQQQLKLYLDLRSEYCGGGSSFVAPAKYPGDATATAHCSSRRSSSVNLDSCCCTVAATRSSSSSSLALSTADDAKVQQAHVGGFGAIGGPSSCHNSCDTACNSSGSSQSCHSGGRALSGSPLGGAAAAGCSSTATATGQAVAAELGARTELAANTAQPSAIKPHGQATKVLQPKAQSILHQKQAPVFAGLCLPQLEELHKLAASLENAECWNKCADVKHAVEHELVGGLLMDEDCVAPDDRWESAGGGVCKRKTNVIDLLPDHL